MQGEIQAGQLVEISTTDVLSATKNPPAWRVHQITDWYSENLGDINTKLEKADTQKFQRQTRSRCHFLAKVVRRMKLLRGKQDSVNIATNTVPRLTRYFARLRSNTQLYPSLKYWRSRWRSWDLMKRIAQLRRILNSAFRNERLRIYQVLLRIALIMRLSNGLQLSWGQRRKTFLC